MVFDVFSDGLIRQWFVRKNMACSGLVQSLSNSDEAYGHKWDLCVAGSDENCGHFEVSKSENIVRALDDRCVTMVIFD